MVYGVGTSTTRNETILAKNIALFAYYIFIHQSIYVVGFYLIPKDSSCGRNTYIYKLKLIQNLSTPTIQLLLYFITK